MSMRARGAALIVAALVALATLAGAPASAAVPFTGSLTTSATQTVWSQYVTLTATLTPPKGTPRPTGTIAFADDEGTIGTAALDKGVARLRTKQLGLGTHVVTARLDDVAVADPVTITVGPAPTTTALVSRKVEVPAGDAARFQATVAAVAPATTTPTGSVAFTLPGSSTPAATVPLVGGVATWWPRLVNGTHTVTATFVPTATHQASTSDELSQVVGTPPPAGTVDQAFEASVNGYGFSFGPEPTFHQTFTVGRTGVIDRVDLRMGSWMEQTPVTVGIVAVDETNTPTGPVLSSGTTLVPGETMVDRVIEIDLDVPLPVRAGERYALRPTSPNGAISIERAPDDGYAGGSVRQLYAGAWYDFPGDIWFRTYVSAPTATLAASPGETVWSQYTDLIATWSSFGAVVPTGTVTFRAGGVDLGTATIAGSTARLRTKALPAGVQEVTATYSGDGAYPAGLTVGSTSVTVGPAATTTALESRKDPVLSGTAWFRARVAPVAPATSTPTGTVAFYLDGATEPAATVALSAGYASWWPRLADGPHTIVARHVATDRSASSTSAPVEQAVGSPAVGAVDQSNAGPATGWEFLPQPDLLAQSFTVGRSGLLDSVTIAFPVAGQTVAVDIWTDGIVQPGSSTGAPQTIQTQQGATTVVLDTPRPVQAGTTYHIVLDGSGAVGDTPQVSTSGDTYGAGQVMRYDGVFGSWEMRSWQDLVFSTTVRPA